MEERTTTPVLGDAMHRGEKYDRVVPECETECRLVHDAEVSVERTFIGS